MSKVRNIGGVLLAIMLLLSTSGSHAAPLSGTVSGRVTNSSGGGIANVHIFIAGVDLYTNSNGDYSGSAPAGSGYNFVAYAPAASPYANAHQFNAVVPEGGTLTKNWTLSSNVGTLTGYIYDTQTQQRLAGATLDMGSDTHDGWSNTLNPTGSDGVYHLDHIAAGRNYYIGAYKQGYTNGQVTMLINTGSNTVNIGLTPANPNIGFNGRVTLPGGGGAAGEQVYIIATTNSAHYCNANTDSNGYYSCNLPPDSYYLHAMEFNGYPGLMYAASLSSGFVTVNFALNNGPVTLHGQVREFHLNPINGAVAQAFEQGPTYGHFRIFTVGSNGNYNFTGMGNAGHYQFLASYPGYVNRVYDYVPIPGNDFPFNMKLGHFSDVLSSAPDTLLEFPFYYAEYLKARNIANGYPDGSFHPTASISRGEYAKLLVTAMGWTIDTSGGPHFSDVPTTNTFYGHIETSYHHNAITGYPDGTFKPNNNVSRAEASKISVTVSGWTLVSPGTPSYSDVPTSQWAYAFIETAKSHGANSNDGGGLFRPNAAGTRAETAKLVCVANTTGCPGSN